MSFFYKIKCLSPCPQVVDLSAEEQFNWGMRYLSGTGFDFKKAVCCLTLAAEKNYLPAQRELGNLLIDKGFSKAQIEKGRRLLLLAAESGDIKAQFRLALHYFDAQDDLNGDMWLLEAATKNYTPALNTLARRCLDRKISEKGVEDAVYYFTLSAESGDAEAFYELGKLDKDPVKALQHFREGARLGHPGALRNVGKLLLPVEPDKAVKYLNNAAEQGDGEAQYLLGLHFAESDPVKSAMWHTIAITFGCEKASEALSKQIEKLSDEQIEESADHVCDWFSRIISEDAKAQSLLKK